MTSSASLDLGLLIVRMVCGFTMAAHGLNKFYGGGRIPGTARWFDSIGMKPGMLHARLAASTELVAGICLVLGLLTPVAGAAFVTVMFVAAYTVHKSFFVTSNGWEYNLVLAAVGVAIATTGPGSWSVDEALGLTDVGNGWWRLLLALGGGLAMSALHLAVFYRPAVPEPETVK
ncbi:MAG: DoxX family protein [Rhodococcus sp. (in: high G+C Gram-positive bacteria)]